MSKLFRFSLNYLSRIRFRTGDSSEWKWRKCRRMNNFHPKYKNFAMEFDQNLKDFLMQKRAFVNRLAHITYARISSFSFIDFGFFPLSGWLVFSVYVVNRQTCIPSLVVPFSCPRAFIIVTTEKKIRQLISNYWF